MSKIPQHYITLQEFQSLSELPNEAILQLLYEGTLPLELINNILFIDSEKLCVESITAILINDTTDDTNEMNTLVFQMRQLIREFLTKESDTL